MTTKKALIKNTISTGWSRSSNMIIQVIQVPVLISALGVEDYGRWLVISSFSAWISLSNIGFGNVASNQISMMVASDNIDEARKTYSTASYLVALITFIGIIISFI